MNWLLKAKITASIILLLAAVDATAARLYLLEVVTADRRFQTVSKLQPDAYLIYNGGNDVILELITVKVYDNASVADVMRENNIGKNNVRRLPFKPATARPPRQHYYWWR